MEANNQPNSFECVAFPMKVTGKGGRPPNTGDIKYERGPIVEFSVRSTPSNQHTQQTAIDEQGDILARDGTEAKHAEQQRQAQRALPDWKHQSEHTVDEQSRYSQLVNAGVLTAAGHGMAVPRYGTREV